MTDPVWSTIDKLAHLLRETDCDQSQFMKLVELYGLDVSQATISRALRDGKFLKHETGERLRPLIMRIEDLVSCAGVFEISFKDAGHIKLLLDLLNDGHKIAPPRIELQPNSSSSR